MPYSDDTFDLTPDQILLKQEAHRFARDVVRPAAATLDALSPEEAIAPGSVFWDVMRASYQAGYHLRGFPKELGGTQLSPLESHIFTEEMAWGDVGLGSALGGGAFPFQFALRSGHPGLMEEVVKPFVEDREGKIIGAWPGTEPGHGSDLLVYHGPHAVPSIHFDVRAERDGAHWRINGQKSAWVSFGTIATHALMFVCIDPSKGMSGTGLAIVPLDLPGVSRGKPTNKIGQRSLNQGEIFFDSVRIPDYYMVVEPGAYNGMHAGMFAGTNAGIATLFTGVARAAFEEALSYSQSRIQGGVPIAQHQLVQKRLFDMFTKVEASRQMSRKAMQRVAAGIPTIEYSIAAKVFCTQAAFEVAADAIMLYGGMGLVKGVLVERLLRDARSGAIEDGSNDILALVAARALLNEEVAAGAR